MDEPSAELIYTLTRIQRWIECEGRSDPLTLGELHERANKLTVDLIETHATQSAELQSIREERDRCCDDYQREAQRAVEAEHRITALQAQLAEARGRAIRECASIADGYLTVQFDRRGAAKGEDPQNVVVREISNHLRSLLAQREPSEATQEGGGDAP